MTSTNLNLNITTSEIVQEALYAIPSSFTKASMIDGAAIYILAPKNIIYNSAMAGIGYNIRTTINEVGKKSFSITENDISTKVILATISGVTGGAFKYYAIGQNPAIGAISTAGYEICDAFKFCKNNPLVYGPAAIAIESFDAAAHTYLKILEGDATGTIKKAAIGGAKIGATVYGLIQGLYIPVTDALHEAGDIAFNSFLSHIDNIIYSGDIDIHSEL